MKIVIDTNNKTLKLEESINLGELAEALTKLFPKNEWKEYKLETNSIITWSNPIVIKEWVYPTYPWWDTNKPVYPLYPNYPITVMGPTLSINSNSGHTLTNEVVDTYTDNNGVFCVEI